MSHEPPITVFDLGRRDYASTLALQRELLARVQADPAQGFLLLVEHDPPVITLGRRGRAEDLLADRAAIAAAGIEVHSVTRGGQTTYHGPGQLVAYPIVALRPLGRTLRQYVTGLEQAVIDTLRAVGVEGGRREGHVGVWADGGKIAAIGVAVEKWVCWHGLAINVCPNLDHFGLIVPCGESGGAVTSIQQMRMSGNTPRQTTLEGATQACEDVIKSIKQILPKCLAAVFNWRSLDW